jgi:hypothetical protein
MSVEAVLQRVAALEQARANPAMLLAAARSSAAAPAAPVQPAAEPADATGGTFADVLQSATEGQASPQTSLASPSTTLPAGAAGIPELQATGLSPGLGAGSQSTGGRIVAIAESQIGQAEQPPGSNESPAIAEYRNATAGAIPGAPWCAYFASWAARQAGAPLGAGGEGLGSVGEIWSWAQSTGRAIPNGPGVVPQPGDLIVFGDQHVGIVKDVLSNGQIQTIEGNYENKVAQNTRSPTEATGYVNMA